MVSIVIVSHSKKIADGVKEFCREFSMSEANIVSTGGTLDNKSGTDVNEIVNAINSVYTDSGVVIFADIGSTILNAKLAIDMLEDDKKSNVVIADAPIVEGSLMGVVEANAGSDFNQVKNAGENSIKLSKIK